MTEAYLRHWPRRLPRDITLPETSLWVNLEISSLRFPDKAAIIFFGNRLRYRRLHEEAEALAGWLQQVAGVTKGDRVLLYMQNCPQFVVAYYAILRADAIVVPVNPMNRAEEFRHYISDAQARVAICASELAGVAAEANSTLPEGERLAHLLVAQYADMLPEVFPHPEDAPPPSMQALFRTDLPLPQAQEMRITRWNEALAGGHVPGPHSAKPDDLAVMPYTSGTTGFPKGCMHTHRSVMHNIVSGSLWGQGSSDTMALSVVPLFHVTGMQYGMNQPIYNGATVVMLPRWDREVAGSCISRHGVTHWTNIPTMVIDLLASPNIERFELGSLRYVGGGGAAMPEAVARRLRDQLRLQYIEGYGLSETIAPTHSNPPENPKLQCLGIPIFGTEARVVDPQTLERMPVGEVGEIVVRGPQVFRGYWRNPEATEAAFVDIDGRRWFRTGDLGRTDEDGYFYLTDRLKRMINASGFKVWPAEVESLLYGHPDVQEACIIGTRDAYRGETVKAVVVLRAPARGRVSEADVIEWARNHMAAYKYPRVVEFVDALPKSGTGKVMWRALQEREDARAGPA